MRRLASHPFFRASLFFLLMATPSLIRLDGQPLDVTQHILAGGNVGRQQGELSAFGRQDAVRWSSLASGSGSIRSKGLYSFGGVPIGELVMRVEAGMVIDESIDIPLVSAKNLPENRENPAPGASTEPPAQATVPSPGTTADGKRSAMEARLDSSARANLRGLPTPPPAAGSPPSGTVDFTGSAALLKRALEQKLGPAFISYSRPGENGESSRSILVWRVVAAKKIVSWRLELFFADDDKYLTGKEPHFARLTVSFSPDLESVIFDPSLFLLRDFELMDRLAVVGLKAERNVPLIASIMGASANITINTKLSRLQNIQVSFTEDFKTSAIVLKKYADPFVNLANTVITSRVRSYPSELTRKKVNYESRDYAIIDGATGQTYTYTDVLKFTTQDVMLVWSPGRGAANYRLSGRTLEILPPGLNIARAIDPTLGALNAGDTFSGSLQGIDFNLPMVSFAEFKRNVIHDRRGVWIDIPMENQGDLPLCLPASMARIMRYFGRQVNQFTLAQVGGVGMRGAHWPELLAIVRTCCEKMGMMPKSLKPNENLGAFVKQNIDNGIPILWLIPGHARIINGYDIQTKSILYTDSWGAGFEVQSMPYAEAEKLTQHAFVFYPPAVIK
jgi:hypothetical protein